MLCVCACVCVCPPISLERDIYFKESVHAVARAGKSEICREAREPGKTRRYSLEAELPLPRRNSVFVS